MNPIDFALRRPWTVLVAVLAVALLAGVAVRRMRIDVFPNLDSPVVYVCQPYGGMDPAQMEGLLTFEATPYYMFEPRVPRLVRELVPDVKLVFLLRDPVDRAFSHYHNNRRLGREPLGFEEALAAEKERLAGEEERMLADPTYVSEPHRLYSYCGRGLYAMQIERWLRHFPAAQMRFVDARRLFADPRGVLADVLAFLGLDLWEPADCEPRNQGRHDDAMAPHTRARLRAFFEPHERRLAELIGETEPAVEIGRRAYGIRSR
jgi:hypothetical protein